MDREHATKLCVKLEWVIDLSSDPAVDWLEDFITNACCELSRREGKVLELIYGFGTTQPITVVDISQQLHVSRQTIHTVANQAIAKLKTRYPETPAAELTPPPQRSRPDRYIIALWIDPIIWDALENHGIRMINFMLQHAPDQLQDKAGLTDGQLAEISNELARRGLYLRGVAEEAGSPLQTKANAVP